MIKLDPKKTKQLKLIKHNSPLLGGRFDPSGRFVFMGAQDNTVQRWEWESGKKVSFVGHKSWIRAVTVHNKVLYSGDYSGRLLSWQAEAAKPKVEKNVQAHKGFLRAMAISPDGKSLATCGNDRRVCLWSLPDLKPVGEFTGHESHVYNVAFHPDGKELVSADLRGVVKVWNPATGNVAREMDASILYKYDPRFRAHIGGVRGMSFSEDGAFLTCAGITNVSNAFAGIGNPLFVVLDWKTGKRSQLMKPARAFKGSGWGVVHHPSNLWLGIGAGGSGGALWTWKPGQEKSFHMLKLPTNARDMDLHPNQKRLLIAFGDGSSRVYDLKS